MGRHVAPLVTHFPDSAPSSLCSYSLMLCVYRASNKYQFYWFNPKIAKVAYDREIGGRGQYIKILLDTIWNMSAPVA